MCAADAATTHESECERETQCSDKCRVVRVAVHLIESTIVHKFAQRGAHVCTTFAQIDTRVELSMRTHLIKHT